MTEFSQLPVTRLTMTVKERDTVLAHLNVFLGWAGNPDQWGGSETKMGVLVKRMHNLRAEIALIKPRPNPGEQE